jgi:hypothetical protein
MKVLDVAITATCRDPGLDILRALSALTVFFCFIFGCFRRADPASRSFS